MKTVSHQFLNSSFFKPTWKVKYLFLGTFNPEGGKKVPYFYGRPGNQMWKIISSIFPGTFNVNDPLFLKNIQLDNIACMDMIRSVTVPYNDVIKITGKGYSDQNLIKKKYAIDYNTETILEVIKNNPDVKIFSTWGNGSRLNSWLVEVQKIGEIIKLISPSPMDTTSLDKKKAEWRNAVNLSMNKPPTNIKSTTKVLNDNFIKSEGPIIIVKKTGSEFYRVLRMSHRAYIKGQHFCRLKDLDFPCCCFDNNLNRLAFYKSIITQMIGNGFPIANYLPNNIPNQLHDRIVNFCTSNNLKVILIELDNNLFPFNYNCEEQKI